MEARGSKIGTEKEKQDPYKTLHTTQSKWHYIGG